MFKQFTCAGLLMFSSVVIAATDSEKNENDDGLLVTSTRIPSDVEKLPASVTIITAKEIEDSTARNLPELLKQEAGINVSTFFGGNFPKATADIRGFGAFAALNTLILLDGKRIYEFDLAGVNFAGISLQNVQRIEIARGSAGSLYGDAAVGGVINIITKKRDQRDFSMTMKALSGTYNTKESSAAVTQNINAFSYRVFINDISSDGYRDNNRLRQKNLSTNFRFAAGNNEWYFSFKNDALSLGFPGERTVDPGISQDQLKDDPRGTNTPNDYADEKNSYYTAGYTRYLGDYAELIIDIGGKNKYQETFSDFGGGFSDYWESDLDNVLATPRLRYHFGSHAGTLGYDFYKTSYQSDRTDIPGNITTPVHVVKVDQTSKAAYVHHTSSISRNWVVNAGARQQSVKQEGVDKFDMSAPGGAFDSGASPYEDTLKGQMYDAGVRYSFTRGASLFYSFARAVRFATVDELFEYDASFQRTFSPLEPQTSSGHTLGIENRIKGENLSLKSRFSVYYMKLKNEIHFHPDTFTNDNLDPTERSGIELEIKSSLGKSTDMNFTYTKTRAVFSEGQYRGNDIPLVPVQSAALSLTWRANSFLSYSISDNFVGRKRMDNDQDNISRQIPEYNVVDLKATGKIDGWVFEAAVYNLLDESYYDYAVRSTTNIERYNAYPLPGRTVTFSVRKDF